MRGIHKIIENDGEDGLVVSRRWRKYKQQVKGESWYVYGYSDGMHSIWVGQVGMPSFDRVVYTGGSVVGEIPNTIFEMMRSYT